MAQVTPTCHGPEVTGMAVAAWFQSRAPGFAGRVVLSGDAGPRVDGIARPDVGGLTRQDDAA